MKCKSCGKSMPSVTAAHEVTLATLWERVDSTRISRGISLRSLAVELGTTPSTLTRWKQGFDPSGATVLRALVWIEMRYRHLKLVDPDQGSEEGELDPV